MVFTADLGFACQEADQLATCIRLESWRQESGSTGTLETKPTVNSKLQARNSRTSLNNTMLEPPCFPAAAALLAGLVAVAETLVAVHYKLRLVNINDALQILSVYHWRQDSHCYTVILARKKRALRCCKSVNYF